MNFSFWPNTGMTPPIKHIPDNKMPTSQFDNFKTICERICFNIPADDKWRWDDQFETALVTFEKKDMELIYFPILPDFAQQWDFVSIDQANGPFFTYFNDQFGLVPGQKIFTAEDDSGVILFAAWWPWSDGLQFSLRIGLYTNDQNVLSNNDIKA